MKIIDLIVVCKYEPRGDFGLEGYMFGEEYRAQRCKGKHEYYRLYPDDEYTPGYYETCSPKAFKKHFKIKEKKHDQNVDNN